MKLVKRLGTSVAAAIMVATGITLVSPASPAQAASCSVGAQYGAYGGSGWATCTGVTRARVQVLCEENSGNRYVAYGPWVGSGSRSTARCHEFAWLVTAGAQWQ